MNPMLTLQEMITLTDLAEQRRNTVAKFLLAKNRYNNALAMGYSAAEINDVMTNFHDLLDTITAIDDCLPMFLLKGDN